MNECSTPRTYANLNSHDSPQPSQRTIPKSNKTQDFISSLFGSRYTRHCDRKISPMKISKRLRKRSTPRNNLRNRPLFKANFPIHPTHFKKLTRLQERQQRAKVITSIPPPQQKRGSRAGSKSTRHKISKATHRKHQSPLQTQIKRRRNETSLPKPSTSEIIASRLGRFCIWHSHKDLCFAIVSADISNATAKFKILHCCFDALSLPQTCRLQLLSQSLNSCMDALDLRSENAF